MGGQGLGNRRKEETGRVSSRERGRDRWGETERMGGEREIKGERNWGLGKVLTQRKTL